MAKTPCKYCNLVTCEYAGINSEELPKNCPRDGKPVNMKLTHIKMMLNSIFAILVKKS